MDDDDDHDVVEWWWWFITFLYSSPPSSSSSSKSTSKYIRKITRRQTNTHTIYNEAKRVYAKRTFVWNLLYVDGWLLLHEWNDREANDPYNDIPKLNAKIASERRKKNCLQRSGCRKVRWKKNTIQIAFEEEVEFGVILRSSHNTHTHAFTNKQFAIKWTFITICRRRGIFPNATGHIFATGQTKNDGIEQRTHSHTTEMSFVKELVFVSSRQE